MFISMSLFGSECQGWGISRKERESRGEENSPTCACIEKRGFVCLARPPDSFSTLVFHTKVIRLKHCFCFLCCSCFCCLWNFFVNYDGSCCCCKKELEVGVAGTEEVEIEMAEDVQYWLCSGA